MVTGTLAYGIGSAVSADMQLTWVDRQGKVLGLAGPPGNYRGIDLSPNGQSVAAHRHEGQGGDLWIVDLGRGTTSRFTFDASQDNSAPIWSADGTAIAFASLRAGKWGIYRKSANSGGVEQKLFETDGATRQAIPMSWAPDGRTLVFSTNDKTWDIWRMTLTGDAGVTPPDHAAHGNVVPMVQTAYTDLHPQISPDGRWMSYWSTETGRSEVAAVSYPSAAAKWQVSVDGGTFPRWRADGRELFFMTLSSRGNMMAVDVTAAGLGLQFGPPHELFDSEYVNLSAGHPYHTFAVSPDGQKFLIPRPIALESKENPVSITVVMNWPQTLNK